jgi:hypothetical protein
LSPFRAKSQIFKKYDGNKKRNRKKERKKMEENESAGARRTGKEIYFNTGLFFVLHITLHYITICQ